jgi:hypothetical protein
VFLLNSGEEVLYGVCVHNREFNHSLPSFLPTPYPQSSLLNRQRATASNRCYCFITRFPFFESHFNVLYAIIAAERHIKVMECMDGEETRPILSPSVNTNVSESRSLIRAYYALNVPPAGSSVNFQITGQIPCDIHLPREKEDGLLSDWCFPILFKSLSLENVMTFFSAILSEIQIIFICQDLGLVSSIVLSTIPLLKPFVWQGPLLPLLPSDLSDFLFSPVPLITGIRTLPDEFLMDSAVNGYLMINLNDNTIRYPKKKIPEIPQKAKLFSLLKKHYYSINPTNAPITPIAARSKTQEQDKIACRRFARVLRNYKSNIVCVVGEQLVQLSRTTGNKSPNTFGKGNTKKFFSKSFLSASPPDDHDSGSALTGRNEETSELVDVAIQCPTVLKKMLRKIPKEERDFWEMLMQSQQFAVFCENIEENLADEQSTIEISNEVYSALLEKEQSTRTTIQEVIAEQQRQLTECEERIDSLQQEMAMFLDMGNAQKTSLSQKFSLF